MELYDVMFKRKSIRKFKTTPLDKETLDKISAFSKTVKPLFPEIKTGMSFENPDEVNGLFSVKAPHYLSIYSQNKEGHYVNAGFMLQQMDLFLSASGLGSCWLGMGKAKEKSKNGLDFIIMLAFGAPDEGLYRGDTSQFNRLTLPEIASGNDARLEAIRLAPSATNGQPWFFACEGGHIGVYRKKLNPVKAAVLERLNKIDIGIALCHLMLASDHAGIPFAFTPDASENKNSSKGYIPLGQVN